MKDKSLIAYDTGWFGSGDLIKTKKGRLIYTRVLNSTLCGQPTIEDDLEMLVRMNNKQVWLLIFVTSI